MKIKTRFIKSIIDAAQSQDVQMPWTRGATRAAHIANRRAQPLRLQARTA